MKLIWIFPKNSKNNKGNIDFNMNIDINIKLNAIEKAKIISEKFVKEHKYLYDFETKNTYFSRNPFPPK